MMILFLFLTKACDLKLVSPALLLLTFLFIIEFDFLSIHGVNEIWFHPHSLLLLCLWWVFLCISLQTHVVHYLLLSNSRSVLSSFSLPFLFPFLWLLFLILSQQRSEMKKNTLDIQLWEQRALCQGLNPQTRLKHFDQLPSTAINCRQHQQ